MKLQFLHCRIFYTAIFLFLSVSIFAQSTVTVKFSVDVSLLVSSNKFSLSADRILIKGSFNSWGDQHQLAREGTTSIFSISISLNANSWFDYKFYNTSAVADNGGWEGSPGFGSNGNRTLNTGTNPITLPVVFFNNAEIALNRTTDHFNFYCSTQDISSLTDFGNKLESEYSRIVTYLQTTIPQKIEVVIYKNLDAYHNAIGYPEFPSWAVGSAWGKTTIQLASPTHAGSTTYSAMLQVVIHEFVHITEAWKTTVTLPIWLNEGVATWFAGQVPTIENIRSLLSGFGGLPQLTLFENSNTFGNIGGYQIAYTVAEFISKIHGADKLAQFVQSLSFSALGYADKAAFQAGWHAFLNNYYINTPPPTLAIGTVRRYAENWFINYAPHGEKDADGNVLTYYISLTAAGSTKTYTDNNHTGTFSIPRSELTANTTYTITGKSWDGIVYTTSTTSKTFTTANTPPAAFVFTEPASGRVAGYNADHKIRIAWSPAMGLDGEGDPITDRITIEGNGLNKTWEITGTTGFLLLDSADLKPDRLYTLKGQRSDGTDAAEAVPLSFTTGNFTGIEDLPVASSFKIYPVPAGRTITIEGYFNDPVNVSIEIISATGDQLHQSQYWTSGQLRQSFDIGGYVPGIYFVRVNALNSSGIIIRQTERIIKE